MDIAKPIARAMAIALLLVMAACAQKPITPDTLPEAPVSPERLKQAKVALKAFGFDPGTVDQSWNFEAYKAAAEFQRNIPGSGDEVYDAGMFKALGIDDFDGTHRTEIFVIDEKADSLATKLRVMTRPEVALFIEELKNRDKKKIDLQFYPPKSIVFVIFVELQPGDEIRTFASNIINGRRNRWSQSYNYRVKEQTPTEPLIIINEFETSNPMILIHHLFINDEQVDARFTRAAA